MASDTEIVEKLRETNDSKYLLELFSRHQNLMYSSAQKYFKVGSQEMEDVASSFMHILYTSTNNYDPNKGSKFSTWLSNQVRYFCLNLKSEKMRADRVLERDVMKHVSELFDWESQSKNSAENFNGGLLLGIQDLLSRVSEPKIRDVIRLRYFSSEKVLSYSEIAKILNITAQTALNWHNKFLGFVRKNIDSVNN